MSSTVTVTRHENIAHVLLNNPPVNALSHAVRVALFAALKELFETPSIEALVITCDGRTFIAGADIREFGKPPLAPDLPELIEFLDSAPQLTIAAIHGTALGGGLELALACDFRLATHSAKLGLPEVALGILPGAGGTQRLPRLIGVQAALDMIVSGTPISAGRAQQLGLVDEIGPDSLQDFALDFAGRLLTERRARRRVSALSAMLEDPGLFASQQARLAGRFRGFLAPVRCIEAVRAAVELPFGEGLLRERELFRELMASSESKAQRHVFFGERDVAKVPGLAEDTPTRPLKSVAILGDASRASRLARCFADAGLAVTLLAGGEGETEQALAALRDGYASAVRRGQISQAEGDARLARVRPAGSEHDASSADLLLEAAFEDPDAQRSALARLDTLGKPSAILASSSELLDLDQLAASTSRSKDVVALHFGAPLEETKLLENVQGPHTAADVHATMMKLGRSLGRVAVSVRGNVMHRLRQSYYREAFRLLHEGALHAEIDLALTEFGFRVGPMAALADAELARLVQGDASAPTPGRRRVLADEIWERCIYSMLNEAARVLEEKAAARPLEIDMICVHGLGFPLYRGGPLFFADQQGLGHVHERIGRYRERVREQDWEPAPLIALKARENGGFYRKP